MEDVRLVDVVPVLHVYDVAAGIFGVIVLEEFAHTVAAVLPFA